MQPERQIAGKALLKKIIPCEKKAGKNSRLFYSLRIRGVFTRGVFIRAGPRQVSPFASLA